MSENICCSTQLNEYVHSVCWRDNEVNIESNPADRRYVHK